MTLPESLPQEHGFGTSCFVLPAYSVAHRDRLNVIYNTHTLRGLLNADARLHGKPRGHLVQHEVHATSLEDIGASGNSERAAGLLSTHVEVWGCGFQARPTSASLAPSVYWPGLPNLPFSPAETHTYGFKCGSIEGPYKILHLLRRWTSFPDIILRCIFYVALLAPKH